MPCTEPRKLICARWASPDLMRTRILTKGSDIWALAMCFWELWLNGKTPYAHLKAEAVVSRLINETLKPSCLEFPQQPGPIGIAAMLDKIFSNKMNEVSAKWLFQQIKGLMGDQSV